MKLHLPKQLFTALLTAITLAAPATLTLNSTAWGARSEITTDTGSKVITYDGKNNTEISTGNTSASDLVIFTMDNAASNNYYTGGNLTATTNANIQIGSIGTATPDDSVGLIITNGNENNTQAYTGTVTGNGILKKIGAGKSGKIRFEGDVTGYTGNIVLGHSDTANTTFTLQFGKDDGTSAVRGSQDAGVAGTGSITFLNSYNLVVFDYEAKADDNSQTVPVYITNAITVNGGTSRVKLSGGADYTFTKDVTIHELTIDDNSSVITFNGKTNLGKTGTANHLTANITAAGAMTLHGVVTNSGTLTVNKGATLSINSAITNNGTLNLNGAVRADSIDKFQLAGYQVGKNVNGLLSQVSYILATGSGNVSVAETAKMYIGSDSDGMTIASSGTNTAYFNVATDGSTYFVFNDTNMSTVNSAFGALESGTIYIADGATLSTDSGATISRPTTLIGSGTYDTNSSAKAANLSLGTNWSGTVVLTGGSRDTQLTSFLTGLYNNNSKVGLRGFTSWLGTDVTAHLVLLKETDVDYALDLNNGFSSGYQNGFKPVFAGAISGDGDIGYTFSGGNTNPDAQAIHEFRGDTSEWSGRFINDGKSGMPDMLVKFTSGNNVFSSDGNGGVEDKHAVSKTTVEINSTSATNFYGSLVNVKQLNIKGNTTLYGALGVTDGVEIDSSKTLTLDNGTITYNGVITGTGNLTKAGEGDVTFGGAIGTENEFFGTLSVGSGSVNLQNTSYLTAMNITGGSATVNNGTIKGLVVTGGSVNLTGNATIGQTGVNMTVGPNKNRTSGIYGYNGTITIGDGETSNTVTTTRVELGDINEANKGGILTVATNATLIITGNNGTASTASGNYGSASFLMGEWGSNSTLNVSGLVLAQNAPLLNGDKQAIININNGGVLAVKGIGRNGGNGVNLTLSDGGKLILGSDGMQSTSTLTSSLNAGTIGIYADTTISKNLTLGSNTTGTKFDTQLYEWSEGGTSISQGEDGGSLTISGVLSGSGKLVKTGAGTLTLSGTNTYSGGTVITGGTLQANTVGAFGSGNITVNEGGELKLAYTGEKSFGSNLTGSGKLTISSGTMVYSNGNDSSFSFKDVVVDSGATLKFSGANVTDAINYGDNSNIKMDVAGVLDLDGTRQTLGGNFELTLREGAIVQGQDGHGGLDFHGSGGKIEALGNAEIKGALRTRANNVTISVAKDKTLTTNTIVDNDASTLGAIVKQGEGTLKITSMTKKQEAFFGGNINMEAGTLEFALSQNDVSSGNDVYNTYTGTISGTGDIKKSGTAGVTLASVNNLAGKLDIAEGSLAINNLNTNQTLNVKVADNASLLLGSASTNGTMELGKVATISNKQGSATSMANVQMSSTGISSTAANGAKGSISNVDVHIAQLAAEASFTIADMTLTNTSITAATVNLNNVVVDGSAMLSVIKPTQADSMTSANVGTGGVGEINYSYGIALAGSSSSLTLNMDVVNAVAPADRGLYNLTITLSGFAESFDWDNIDSQVVFGADSWLGEALSGVSASVVVDGTTISEGAAAAQSGSGAPIVSYSATSGEGSNVGTLVITITGLNVPEPTTSTLSLLALAGLCARRRRKM